MGNPFASLMLALSISLSATVPVHAQEVESFAPGSRQGQKLPEEQHATSHENVEMLQLAGARPDAFLGRMLTMSDGRKAGEILSVKRNREDKLLYLIIEGEPYFKREVEFAVPTLDVDRIRGTRVILNELPGDFLRGFEYKEAEFQDADTYEEWPLIVDE